MADRRGTPAPGRDDTAGGGETGLSRRVVFRGWFSEAGSPFADGRWTAFRMPGPWVPSSRSRSV